jgi:outer membrane protein
MTRIAAAACSLLLLAPAARAAEKLGYVDVAKVLADSRAGKTARAQLDKGVKERQSRVDEEKRKLEALKADYERNASTLTDQQKQARQQDFQEKAQAYQKTVAGARKEVSDSDAEQTRKVMEQMRLVIDSIGKADDYGLIVEKSATSVLYAKDGTDLTGKVVRQMDAQK